MLLRGGKPGRLEKHTLLGQLRITEQRMTIPNPDFNPLLLAMEPLI